MQQVLNYPRATSLIWKEWQDWSIGCGVFPWVCGGTTKDRSLAIIQLPALLKVLSNETNKALTNWATEQKGIRKLVLQTTIALDIVLASKGGVCALIHQHCCIYIPDLYHETIDRAQYFAKLAVNEVGHPHQILSLFNWLFQFVDISPAVSALLSQLLTSFFIILILTLFYQLLKQTSVPLPMFPYWAWAIII